MTSQAEKAKAFRALHEADGIFVIPNPWDVGSAKMLENLGFKALATTSAGHAFSMGVPEGFTTNQDVLEHCFVLSEATGIPVSADLEMGFGDSPKEAAETIRLAAPTGLAGCSIEDHTGRLTDPIYDFELAVERIAAAAEAARGLEHDFILTARAENYLHGRPFLDDTIKRLVAFEEAGADVLYAPGLPDLDAIRQVCSALAKPVNVVMGLPGKTFNITDLADAGVKRISVGSAFARLAYGAMFDAVQEIQQGGTFGFTDRAAGFADIEKLLK
ncbi:Probable carboxyvinyl-carboxyphosphonate phosphorylmutase [hydrothermal vent metagenome]|uniref:Probable carboxyvinyl-carboxyphosphonate phosphorylmutase n=1 Tax=hydrothermal vent metagenome TaxID=652676 RepID=A0A3B0RSN4_9ZZZZ